MSIQDIADANYVYVITEQAHKESIILLSNKKCEQFNNFLLEGDYTVHIVGTTKGREQIQKFTETRGSRYI